MPGPAVRAAPGPRRPRCRRRSPPGGDGAPQREYTAAAPLLSSSPPAVPAAAGTRVWNESGYNRRVTPRVNLADLVARRVPLVPREAAALTLAVAREWDRQRELH